MLRELSEAILSYLPSGELVRGQNMKISYHSFSANNCPIIIPRWLRQVERVFPPVARSYLEFKAQKMKFLKKKFSHAQGAV